MMETTSNPTPRENLAAEVARVLEEGTIAVLVTLLEDTRGAGVDELTVGAKFLVDETGARRAGGLGNAALDAHAAAHAIVFLATRADARTFKTEEFSPSPDEWRGVRLLFERLAPEPRIVVCGAGHVGASLARLAQAVGYRVMLIDDRADFLSRARFPAEIDLLVADKGWTEAVRAGVGHDGRGVAVAVVTRGHNEDEECMRAVLAARPGYVGMIGSRRRTNIVLERLRAAGIDETLLREVRAPIGLDIGAVAPEEVALAVLAEIVAHRRGGTGAPLSAWRREQVSKSKKTNG